MPIIVRVTMEDCCIQKAMSQVDVKVYNVLSVQKLILYFGILRANVIKVKENQGEFIDVSEP